MDSLGKKCNSSAVEKAKPSNSMLNANTGLEILSNFHLTLGTMEDDTYGVWGRYDKVHSVIPIPKHFLGVVEWNLDFVWIKSLAIAENDDSETDYIGAWVTTAVPIPGAVWLFASGLIGLVGIRRRFRK